MALTTPNCDCDLLESKVNTIDICGLPFIQVFINLANENLSLVSVLTMYLVFTMYRVPCTTAIF